MYLFQYDFKIEFYGADSAAGSPKFYIATNNGAPEISISIGNSIGGFKTIKNKSADIVIFNLPMDFNNKLKHFEIIKVYYKKFSFETKFNLIFGGKLSLPMDTDYENGEFSVDLKVELAGSEDFFNTKLETTNFQNKTVAEAITSVFPTNSILLMTTEEQQKVITSQLVAKTPKEFVEKMLHSAYVSNITRDVGQFSLNAPPPDESKPQDDKTKTDKSKTDKSKTPKVDKSKTPKVKTPGVDEVKDSGDDASGDDEVKDSGLFAGLLEGDSSMIGNYIFRGVKKGEVDDVSVHKKLERYGLIFIPQQDLQRTPQFKHNIIYWNAQVVFTHKLIPGDKVSFVDRAGELVRGVIQECNASLSNVGDCILNLKIRDSTSPAITYAS